ncbi:MAG: protein kinase [Deltaproteobacteria bacterium]|nr:protein kinase [Deltaproteobacteria bacterium]
MADFQPVRFGKYFLMEKLAAGGMAQLYRAKIMGDQGFEKFIAIKQILPHLAEEKEFLSSFIDEAKLAALLHHQNIVQIYDFGSAEGAYFITMEYLYGKDLRVITQKSKEKGLPLSLENCLFIISRICAGLDYAHNLKDFQGKPLNIIHRDISPQNIILTYEGDVKIVDFGIAKARSRSTITQVGMIKGKVAYMSPEQASGKAVDSRADIFPTGILLYEMLSGRRMFTGDTLQILAKVSRAEFDPPEAVMGNLSPKLYKILHRALAKEPDQRYQSGGEMLADLEECMFELSLRPTARGLAQYMKDLFKEEIIAEEQVMRRAAGAGPAAEIKLPVARDEQPAEKKWVEKEPEPPIVAAQELPQKIPKKRNLLYAAVAAALVAVIGVVIAFWPKTAPVTPPVKDTQAASAKPSVAKPPEETAPASTKVSPPDSAKITAKVSDSQARAKALQSEAAELLGTQPEKAKNLLIESVKLDPVNVQGLFQLGLVYMNLGDYPKAIETYNKVGELDPQFPDTFFNLGYIYAKKKDYPKAEEMYARVVKLAPTYLDEALFNLGMVQDKQGKREQCIENLEQALKVNPNNDLAKKFLTRLKGKS